MESATQVQILDEVVMPLRKGMSQYVQQWIISMADCLL